MLTAHEVKSLSHDIALYNPEDVTDNLERLAVQAFVLDATVNSDSRWKWPLSCVELDPDFVNARKNALLPIHKEEDLRRKWLSCTQLVERASSSLPHSLVQNETWAFSEACNSFRTADGNRATHAIKSLDFGHRSGIDANIVFVQLRLKEARRLTEQSRVLLSQCKPLSNALDTPPLHDLPSTTSGTTSAFQRRVGRFCNAFGALKKTAAGLAPTNSKRQLFKEIHFYLVHRFVAMARAGGRIRSVNTTVHRLYTKRLECLAGRSLLTETITTAAEWHPIVRNMDPPTAAALLRSCSFGDASVRSLIANRIPHLHIFNCPGMCPHGHTESGEWVAETEIAIRVSVGLVTSRLRSIVCNEDDEAQRAPSTATNAAATTRVFASERRLLCVDAKGHGMSSSSRIQPWSLKDTVPLAECELFSVDPSRYLCEPPEITFELVDAETQKPTEGGLCAVPGMINRSVRLCTPMELELRRSHVSGRVEGAIHPINHLCARRTGNGYKSDGFGHACFKKVMMINDPTMTSSLSEKDAVAVKAHKSWRCTAVTASFFARSQGAALRGRFRIKVSLTGRSIRPAGETVTLTAISPPIVLMPKKAARTLSVKRARPT